MSRLELLAGDAWRGFVDAPVAVLVLGRNTCPVCKAWSEELAAFLEADRRWRDVRFGRIDLDADGPDDEDDDSDALARALSGELGLVAPGLAGFARASEDWLPRVTDLPYNVVFLRGKKVKGWAGGGIDRLVRRLERIGSGG